MNAQNAHVQQLLDIIHAALDELKAKDALTLDVRPLTSMSDAMVIVSGTSSRHVKSLADNVVEKAKAAGFRPIGVEGEREGEWVLIDLAEVIVHVMLPATRAFYDLERLWTAPAPATAAQ